MELFAGLFGMAILVMRIAVPIYLYQQAKLRDFPTPWVWILFGIFEPIVAYIAYYVLVYVKNQPRL